MEPMIKRNQVMTYVIFISVLGFLLRILQLKYAFDSEGLMLRGSGSIGVLAAVSVIVVIGSILFCRQLEQRPCYTDAFSDGILEMLLTLASGVTLLCGSLLGAVKGDVVVGALGVLASACFVIIGVGRFRGRMAPLAIHLFPCLYLICKLIIDFKRWSIDPALLDYCFSLLAMICVMCATYHIDGFCFNKGKRPLTVFWCLCGVFFCTVTLADPGLQQQLVNGALGLWLFVNAWQLLERPVSA